MLGSAAQQMALLAEQHIAQQEARVERQKELIAQLEKDGHEAMARDARRLLDEIIGLLVRMHDDLLRCRLNRSMQHRR
jgi:hypothetical protein